MTQFHSIFFKNGDEHGACFKNMSNCLLTQLVHIAPSGEKPQIFEKVGLKINLAGEENIYGNF